MTQTQPIPEGWREMKIGNLGKVITGKTPSKNHPEDRGGLVDFVTPSDISGNSKYISNTERKLSKQGKKRFNRLITNRYSIIVTCIGSDMGKVVINKNDCLTNQQINSLAVNHENSIDFIFYKLIHSYPLLRAYADGGSTMPILNKSSFESLKLLIPPLPEQQAIASVLSSLDDKIELLREQNKTLEFIAQTLFHEWFVKFNFPGATGEMVESELGDLPAGEAGIPKGWRVGKVGDIVDLLNGFAFKSSDFSNSGKYKLVTIANVQDGSFVKETKDKLDKVPSKMNDYCHLSTGDILMSLTGNVGRICHVIGENYLLNQRVAKLYPKNDLDFAYVYLYFRQKIMITKLENISSGTAQQNLSPIKTSDMEALIPARNVLDEYSKVATPLVNKMLKNYIQIETLSKTRDTLLPNLMSGEVRVRF